MISWYSVRNQTTRYPTISVVDRDYTVKSVISTVPTLSFIFLSVYILLSDFCCFLDSLLPSFNMVPPPLGTALMHGLVTAITVPAIQPSVLVVKPSPVVVTDRMAQYNNKKHILCDKNCLEREELPGFKKDEPEDDIFVFVGKNGTLHGDTSKVETPKDSTDSEDQFNSEQASIHMLHKISMTVMNRLIDSVREKERQLPADTKNTTQTRDSPYPKIKSPMDLSSDFLNHIHHTNHVLNFKVHDLKALSDAMEQEAWRHSKVESEYKEWQFFREFSASFQKAVQMVYKFTNGYRKNYRTNISCDQLTEAFHEIFALVEAMKDEAIYKSELLYYENDYLKQHHEVHHLYIKALKHCLKSAEHADLPDETKDLGKTDLKQLEHIKKKLHNNRLHNIGKKTYHKARPASDEPSRLKWTDKNLNILPRGIEELKHGIMHRVIGWGALAALGSLAFLIGLFCTWFKRCCARHTKSRQLPMVESSQRGYSEDANNDDDDDNNDNNHWDEESMWGTNRNEKPPTVEW